MANCICVLLSTALMVAASTPTYAQSKTDDPDDVSALQAQADSVRLNNSGNISAITIGMRSQNTRTYATLKHLSGLHDLVELKIGGCSNNSMKRIAEYTTPKRLTVYSRRLTDVGMESLGELSSIEELYLSAINVTPDGLSNLGNLKNLRVLTLFTRQATDETMQVLAGLENLEILRLIEPKITDAGVEHLSGISTLKELDLCAVYRTEGGFSGPDREELYGCKMTDAGLEHIAKLTKLETLALTNTRIGPGLKQLENLENLRFLILDKTDVSDSDIEHILKLDLTTLFLFDTDVTDYQKLRDSIADVRGRRRR